MSRGLWESLFGLLFSWLPGVGLILAVAGFCRQAVRLTEKHKVRRFLSVAFASAALVAAIGVLVGEAYLYSRDPGFAGRAGLKVWQSVTGQQTLPGAGTGEVGEDAVPTAVPDEYNTDGEEEGDVPVDDEQTEEGDVPVGDEQTEEGDVPVGDEQTEEGDFQEDIDFSEDESDEDAGPEQSLPPLRDLLKSYGVGVG